MHIALYTDTPTPFWPRTLLAAGHEVCMNAIGTPVCLAADLSVVEIWDIAALAAARFWLTGFNTPTLLMTASVTQVDNLCQQIPAVRMIVHSARALGAPADFIDFVGMTRQICAGRLVIGPVRSRSIDEHDRRNYVGK